MKEAAAADESATRGVSPPGAPPTSPSTVTSTRPLLASPYHISLRLLEYEEAHD